MTLREEWLERIKNVNPRDIFGKYGRFSVKTDFYEAPEEIRNDEEMCFKVVMDSDEYLWNIPTEIKTPEFLTKLMNSGCKQNLLKAINYWSEDYYDFIIQYAKLKKESNEKVEFDIWVRYHGLLKDRDIVLDFVQLGILSNKDILMEYKKDKEIMTQWVDNNLTNFSNLLKSIKNHYLKDETKIFKLLDSSANFYNDFPEKFQLRDDVIEYAIKKSSEILLRIPDELINNKEKMIQYINNCPNIQGNVIPYIYRDDIDIAKILIERKGKNFTSFNFKGNEELIRLANKTYKILGIIPLEEKYKELMIETVLNASKNENDVNFSYENTHPNKIEIVKHLMLDLYKEDKISDYIIKNFFNKKLYLETETGILKTQQNYYKEEIIKNDVLNKQMLIEFVKLNTYFFKETNPEYKDKDFNYLQIFIKRCMEENINFDSYLPISVKVAARTENIEVEKYILNKYLEEKLKDSPNIKRSKI